MAHSSRRIALVALAASILLLGAKLVVAWWTGSVAVLSDGLEGLVNVVTSLFTAWAVTFSTQPRDPEHPYGHGKVEYLSVALEGGLLLAASCGVLAVALWRMYSPAELGELDAGAMAMALIAGMAWATGAWLEKRGRALESPALEANGTHLRIDALTSAGIFVGLSLVFLTGATWLDSAIALGLGLWMGWMGTTILRRALGGILDEANPALLDRIARRLTLLRQPGWLAPHNTKVHRLGQQVHIDLHMVYPHYWTLQKTHDAATLLEEGLREEFGARTEVMVHMEPCTPVSCNACDMPDCPARTSPFHARRTWDAESIARVRRAQPWDVESGEAAPDDASSTRAQRES